MLPVPWDRDTGMHGGEHQFCKHLDLVCELKVSRMEQRGNQRVPASY